MPPLLVDSPAVHGFEIKAVTFDDNLQEGSSSGSSNIHVPDNAALDAVFVCYKALLECLWFELTVSQIRELSIRQ